MNFYFTGSEILTVCVLIMSTERGSKPETFMVLALWVYFPSICAFPDSFSSSNLTLQHCHTPHWLPWRNSPPGLQGTRAYCLWLLYLDENMICWKGSTCFFSSHCYSLLPWLSSSSFSTWASASTAHDTHCFLLLSRSLTVHVCASRLQCVCMSAWQEGGQHQVPPFATCSRQDF